MRVLFCTDGSKISYQSIINFSHWVKDFSVDILSVVDLSFLPDNVPVENEAFSNWCANSADNILDSCEKYLKGYGINVDKKIKLCGSAVDTILEVSEKGDYDYLILGSHGKKGIQKWLGSVSQEVASSSKISTYISKTENEGKRILFSVDSLALSPNVITSCLKMLDLADKEIYLVTVYEIPDYLFLDGNMDSNWIVDVGKKLDKSAGILLNQIERIFKEKGINLAGKIILQGIPAQEIIKYSINNNIDLVISGVRDRSKFAKLLLGSVSNRILENADADVLIVREHQ